MFVLTLICLFMVMQKSMMKYITSIGQNTGTLKASKNVQIMAMTMPFVAECLKRKVNTQSESNCYLKQQEQGVHVQPCTEEQDYVSYKEKENVCI